MSKFTPEQRSKIINRVEKLRKKGLPLQDACREAGTTTASYYSWTRESDEPTKVVFNKTPETKKRKYSKKVNKKDEVGKVFAFYGTPEDIKNLMGELNG